MGVNEPAEVQRWAGSDSLSQRQVDEWSFDEDNAKLYASPIEERREFLSWKAQYLDWRNTPRYWRALGVPMKGNVLELGAGNFWLSSLISSLPEVERVTGIELSESRMTAFRDLTLELFPNSSRRKISYVIGDMHRIEAEDNTFDVVTCDATLHHADNLVTVLREAWRVLKPGGFFITLREPSISPLRRYLNPPRFHSRFPEDGSAMYYYPDGWRSAFTNAWFQDFAITAFVEYGIVKGHHVSNWLLRSALRRLDLRILLAGYPKVAMRAKKPGRI